MSQNTNFLPPFSLSLYEDKFRKFFMGQFCFFLSSCFTLSPSFSESKCKNEFRNLLKCHFPLCFSIFFPVPRSRRIPKFYHNSALSLSFPLLFRFLTCPLSPLSLPFHIFQCARQVSFPIPPSPLFLRLSLDFFRVLESQDGFEYFLSAKPSLSSSDRGQY